jgi:cold shock protein
MFTGTVKMFSERGFGFITRDDGAGDVFVHISAVAASGLRALQPGDRVGFNLVAGRAGREQAADVRLLDAEAA